MTKPLPSVRIGMLLLSLSFFGQPAWSQTFALNQRATIKQPVAVETRKLKDALQELKNHYRVDILFEGGLVDNVLVTPGGIDYNQSIERNLDAVLKTTRLHYKKVKDGSYLILEDKRSRKKTSFAGASASTEAISALPGVPGESQPDQKEIEPVNDVAAPKVVEQVLSGKVTDENGAGLPGVSVVIKNTSRGTTTDGEGKFRLNIPDNRSDGSGTVLVFSFVGYQNQEIAIGNRTAIDVVLVPDTKSLQEVVVTGYNTQQRRDITGSVVTIKESDLKAVPAGNLAQQLQGRAAGVMVSNDNTPGGGVAVRIRGIGSVTGSNDPLYVIDGVPTIGGLNQINSNDIETMQILKDASAASIYGARANNGVVVITTKKGKAGAAKITYNMYEGVQDPGKGPDLLNPQQYLGILWVDYKSRGLVNPDGTLKTPDPRYGGGTAGVIPDYIISLAGGTGVSASDPRLQGGALSHYTLNYNDPAFNKTKFIIYQPSKQGTNWWDLLYNPAPIRNHNITVSGGSEQGRYAISADYFQQDGIVINNSFKRYSVRANTEFTVRKVVRIGENFSISATDNVGVSARNEFSPYLGWRGSPIDVPYDIGGNFVGSRVSGDNGITDLIRLKDNHGYVTRFFGNLYAEADLFKRITARTSLGVDYTTNDSQTFTPAAPESNLKSQLDVLNVNFQKSLNLTWTNTLNYQQTFGDHQLQVLVGTEAITQSYQNVDGSKNTFAFTDPDFRTLSAATNIGGLTGGKSASSLFSLFGKIDYKFLDRYLFSATVRRDASSRFAPTHRWGTFPAFSVGWIVSEERFLKPVSAISNLKVRAGWGTTGNQEIDPYNQYTTYAYSNINSSYPIAGGISGASNLYPGYEPRLIGNPNAQWEQQSMVNVGVDVTLFNRLSFTAEWYNRTTSKLLLVVPAPGVGGQNAVAADNVGEVTNKGIDLSLNYDGGNTKGFTYGIGINWSTYKNNVTKLYDGDNPFIAGPLIRQQIFTRTQVGQPISSFYGMVNEGLFRSQEEADSYLTQFGNRSIYNQPGRLKYQNVNGDTAVNGQDLTFIGNPHPKFTYGINLTAGYKGLDLTVFLQGVYGNDIYNFIRQTTDLMLYGGNKSTRILDYWSPQNPNGSVPTPNTLASPQEFYQTSSYFIEKGSYLRAKNLQIGYRLPTALLSKLHIDRLRIYVQATNLFTITKYKGLDPEVNLLNYGVRGNEVDRGVDRGIYPPAKTYMIGLQLGF